MSTVNTKYSHIQVRLSDLLDYIEHEILESQNKALLRESAVESEIKLSHLVGRLQGINHVRVRVENHFGVQSGD